MNQENKLTLRRKFKVERPSQPCIHVAFATDTELVSLVSPKFLRTNVETGHAVPIDQESPVLHFAVSGEAMATITNDRLPMCDRLVYWWDEWKSLPRVALLPQDNEPIYAYPNGVIVDSNGGKRCCVQSGFRLAGLAVSKDGKQVATGLSNRTVNVYARSADGSLDLSSTIAMVGSAIDFDRDGRVVGCRDDGGHLVDSNICLGRGVRALVTSPSGDFGVSCSENGWSLWSIANDRIVCAFPKRDICSVAISPNGRRVATASTQEVEVWDIPPRTFAQLRPSKGCAEEEHRAAETALDALTEIPVVADGLRPLPAMVLQCFLLEEARLIILKQWR